MIYVTGEKDTMKDLKEMDEYKGLDYEEKLLKLNPRLGRSKGKPFLPPFTPILLVGNSPPSEDLKKFVRDLDSFKADELKALHQLQENKVDMPTLVATDDVMREFQDYASEFRNRYDSPLISTPWGSSAPYLNKGNILDLFAKGSGIAAGSLYRWRHVQKLEPLYEAMCVRDALNLEIAKWSKLGRAKHFAQIIPLEAKVKEQTSIIKSLLPKKYDQTLSGFLVRRGVDVNKIRSNAYSKKMAVKGKYSTLRLDLLNKAGLARAKLVIKGLVKVGEYAEKASFMLGIGIVTYDTIQAYNNKEDYMRTFFSGTAGFGTAVGLGALGTTELGACAIGMLAGDAALGGIILISSPVIGTVAAIVVGLAIIGATAYGASKLVEYAWDSEIGQECRHDISTFTTDMYKKLESAWRASSNWVLSFYNSDSKAHVAN